jgi:hypothetical protein
MQLISTYYFVTNPILESMIIRTLLTNFYPRNMVFQCLFNNNFMITWFLLSQCFCIVFIECIALGNSMHLLLTVTHFQYLNAIIIRSFLPTLSKINNIPSPLFNNIFYATTRRIIFLLY